MQKAVRKEKMKVIERPVSLRDMLEKLKAEGDLIESDKPVDPDLVGWMPTDLRRAAPAI